MKNKHNSSSFSSHSCILISRYSSNHEYASEGLSSYSRQSHVSQADLELTLPGEHHQSQSWGNWDSHIYNCRAGQGHLTVLRHLQITCHCPVPSLRDKRMRIKPKRLRGIPLCLTQLYSWTLPFSWICLSPWGTPRIALQTATREIMPL